MGASSRSKGKIRTRSVITILAALSLLGSLAAPSVAYTRPGDTQLVTDWSGASGDLRPYSQGTTTSALIGPDPRPDVTPDGRYVLFGWGVAGVVAPQIFVWDRLTRKIEMITRTPAGTPSVLAAPNGLSPHDPGSISDDGRYVVFESHANDLVESDPTPNEWDVYLLDRRTRRMIVIAPGVGPYTDARISGNGRVIAFDTDAQLTPEDTDSVDNVYVHDIKAGKTELLPAPLYGCPDIDRSGRRIAASAPVGGRAEVYLHDRVTEVTERVSVASDGSESSGVPTLQHSGCPALSADGQVIAFASSAQNFVPNDTYRLKPTDPRSLVHDGDVFVHHRKTGRTTLVSVTRSGEEIGAIPAGTPGMTSISPDGRFVGFVFGIDELVQGDTSSAQGTNGYEPGDHDVILHDLVTGSTELASKRSGGTEAPDCPASLSGGDDPVGSWSPSIGSGGRYVAFATCSPIDKSDDDVFPLLNDFYLHDRGLSLDAGQIAVARGLSFGDHNSLDRTGSLARLDPTTDLSRAMTDRGANLYGASIAYRPQYSDLFSVIELEHMPKVLPGISPIFYGLRFEVQDKSYEVRATSLNFGTFGLFDCTDSSACTKVADLRGGYGTTGMRVVFSLPLEEIGLESGGELKDVEAFSAIGSLVTGAAKILDTTRFD